jgi:serpin B
MNKAFKRWLAAAVVLAGSVGLASALADQNAQPPSTGSEILLPTRQALAWEKLSAAAAPSGSPVAGYSAAVQPPPAAAAGGVNLFALDLYGQLKDRDGRLGNLFFSPYSISSAMAMAYAGARGSTAKEMLAAMHFSCAPMAQIKNDASDRQAIVFTSGQLTHRLSGDMKQTGFQLVVASSLWGQIGHPILPEYLDVVKKDFAGDATPVDFVGHADEARQQINKWVSGATLAKIETLFAPGAVSPDARIILANAIYFKAAWMDKFDAKSTAKADFHAGNGKTVQANMMHAGLRLLYAEDDQCQMVELPYSEGELAMIILLPKENIRNSGDGRPDPAKVGLHQMEAALSTSYINKLTSSASDHQVNLALPRWEATQAISLGQILQAMGIKRAFTAGADFSGIDGQSDLFLSDVIHKAYIHVDEEGTEAAAATAITIKPTAEPPPATSVDFTADHPFAYFIVDQPTNTILFAGRLCDPTTAN